MTKIYFSHDDDDDNMRGSAHAFEDDSKDNGMGAMVREQ